MEDELPKEINYYSNEIKDYNFSDYSVNDHVAPRLLEKLCKKFSSVKWCEINEDECNEDSTTSRSVVGNIFTEKVIPTLVAAVGSFLKNLKPTDFNYVIDGTENLSLMKQMKTANCSEHAWYYFNASARQWISHPQKVCKLLEKTLDKGKFEINCQSNGVNIVINLITMEQSHLFNGTTIVSDIKLSWHQVKQSRKNDDTKVDSRKQLLHNQCHKFESNEQTDNLEAIDLMRHLFPLLIDIYDEANSHQVSYKCFEAMIRMIYPTTNKALNCVLNKASLSSLMASLLTSQDSTILINSIQMGTIIKKLPSTLILNFKKEGVLYQLDRISSTWSVKMRDMSSSRNPSTSMLSTTESNISMTISAPPGSLDQLTTDQHTNIDYTITVSLRNSDGHQLHNQSDIIKLDQSMERFSDPVQLSSAVESSQILSGNKVYLSIYD